MKTILVVDDDLDLLKIMHARLTANGYAVVTAGGANEAYAKLKEIKPDLIMLDVMMPEISGYDVCHTLKIDSTYKNIPILLLTGRNQELDPRIGKMMGIDYMQKPYKDGEVLAKVQELLK